MRRTEAVMGGMPFTVDVPGATGGELFDAIFDRLRQIDRTFSPFIADSAVSRINAWTLAERDAGPDIRAVLELCRTYQASTDGYFSAWSEGRLDPCGLVKGLGHRSRVRAHQRRRPALLLRRRRGRRVCERRAAGRRRVARRDPPPGLA
ncbi:MAG TPA: FAD:protein FMN transferase [Candidatus Limnocylindria bacterium]|nr:FAD:protein FMN transferase [Candidatus Limnocylindria bacterium]